METTRNFHVTEWEKDPKLQLLDDAGLVVSERPATPGEVAMWRTLWRLKEEISRMGEVLEQALPDGERLEVLRAIITPLLPLDSSSSSNYREERV